MLGCVEMLQFGRCRSDKRAERPRRELSNATLRDRTVNGIARIKTLVLPVAAERIISPEVQTVSVITIQITRLIMQLQCCGKSAASVWSNHVSSIDCVRESRIRLPGRGIIRNCLGQRHG